MNHTSLPFKLARTGFNATVGAALLVCAFGANAAAFTFLGVTDSGALVGSTFGGSFSYTDPAPADGSVNLSAFNLSFAGQTYSLGSADIFAPPVAWFSSGSFVGIDYADTSAGLPNVRPRVQLVAGFSHLSGSYFAYDAVGTGIEGFGSYRVTAVPEPATMAMLLAGLGLLGVVIRTRRR